MKKIIPYILILFVAIGIFASVPKAEASKENPNEPCEYGRNGNTLNPPCIDPGFVPGSIGGGSNQPKEDPNQTELKNAVDALSCVSFWKFDPGACVSAFAYYVFFALPAFILAIVANLFNVLLGTTINGTLYNSSSFVGDAWVVVRDLSNIFFIIILLYAAIEMILGIGHGGKKVIGSVIIMALLINFSMFFTKVVIDSSNILALVFYNKIIVNDNPANPYQTTMGEKKDIGGAIAGAFNPAKLMTPKLLQTNMRVNGVDVPVGKNSSIILAIIFTSCVIFLFAAYAFLISGLSFLGRMIELWILIIFSPFAFMSFALPKLASIEGIGWEDWTKRLIRSAFMAPIFMFFLYLISKITQKPVLDGLAEGTSFLSVLLLIIVPAMIQIILLLKATEYAKKGSGQLGEVAIGLGKSVAGLAVGAGLGLATGGAAIIGRRTLGAKGNEWANNDEIKKIALAGGKGSRMAKLKLSSGNYLQKKTFDARQTGAAKLLEKKTGISADRGMSILGLDKKSLEGGRKEQVEQEIKQQKENAKMFEMSKVSAQENDAKADIAKAINKRADQYEKDKTEARKFAASRKDKKPFDESAFKLAYESNEDMAEFGVYKRSGGGNVDRVAKVPYAKDINNERKDTYYNTLASEYKEGAKGALDSFFSGFKDQVTPSGLARAGVATVIAPPVGAVISIVGGGFLAGLKNVLSVSGSSPEVIAGAREKKDKKEDLVDKFTKAINEEKEKEDSSEEVPIGDQASETESKK